MSEGSREGVETLERAAAILTAGGMEVEDGEGIEKGVLKVGYLSPRGREAAWIVASEGVAEEAEAYIQGEKGTESSDDVRVIVLESADERVRKTEDRPWGNAYVTTLEALVREVLLRARVGELSQEEVQKRAPAELEIQPLQAEVEHNGKEGVQEIEDLERYLGNALQESLFIALIGGFGRGKTTSLYLLARRLAEGFQGEGSKLFPLFIDTAGWVAQGLDKAIEYALANRLGLRRREATEDIVSWFAKMVGPQVTPVLLLDSLDEQEGLHPREMGRLADEIVSMVSARVRIVCAFRPEVLSGEEELDLLIKRRLREEGLESRFIRLLPLAAKELALKNGEEWSQELDATVKELARRPLWLSYLRDLASDSNLSRMTLLEVVEECIDRWARREALTRRPILIPPEREGLTMIVAFCLYTHTGPVSRGPRKMAREDLLVFLRRILEKLYDPTEGIRRLTKWFDLSRDLAAESVAVANLLTSDKEGYWQFSEKVFFEYYLARALILGVSGTQSVLSENAFLDEIGVVSPKDLIGIAPLPTSRRFELLLEEILRKSQGEELVYSNLQRMIEERSTDGQRIPPPIWEDLVVGEEELMVEEARSYEIALPASWPSYSSAFATPNSVSLLSFAQNRNKVVTGLNGELNFADFTGADLHGFRFEDCELRGADFSYAKLEGTEFVDCDLSEALFYQTKGANLEALSAMGGLVIEAAEEIEDTDSEVYRRLDALCGPGEEWFLIDEPVECDELAKFPLSLKLVLMDIAPISNNDFLKFIEGNGSTYSRREHAYDIENDYYLLYLRPEWENKPLVYVSLVAAVAYAMERGKRLPTYFELKAYEEYVKARTAAEGVSGQEEYAERYEDLPDIVKGERYPVDLVSEWTYQIDDRDHWKAVRRNEKLHRRGVWPLAPYRRTSRARCEYLVWGKSFLRGEGGPKNSKPATWINPDQGFRCVMDYRTAVRRGPQEFADTNE